MTWRQVRFIGYVLVMTVVIHYGLKTGYQLALWWMG